MILERAFLPLLPDVGFQCLVADNHVVVLGELLQLHHQLGRIYHVNDKDAKEHANEEGEGQIPGQPIQAIQDVGVDQEIVESPQNCPEEGEQRADNTLDIAPEIGVIPQPHFQEFQAEHTCHILHKGHADGHGDEEHHLIPQGIGNQAEFLQRRQQVQHAQAEAVNRKIGAGAEARVNQLIRMLDNVAEPQLQQPAKAGAYKKQVSQGQYETHSNHSLVNKIITNDEHRGNNL